MNTCSELLASGQDLLVQVGAFECFDIRLAKPSEVGSALFFGKKDPGARLTDTG